MVCQRIGYLVFRFSEHAYVLVYALAKWVPKAVLRNVIVQSALDAEYVRQNVTWYSANRVASWWHDEIDIIQKELNALRKFQKSQARLPSLANSIFVKAVTFPNPNKTDTKHK